MAKLPWVDAVSIEPCGAIIDCRGGLEEYLRAALGDERLASGVASRAMHIARSIQAPYGARMMLGLRAAMELGAEGAPGYSEELGRGLVESIPGWSVFPDSAEGISLLRESGYRVILVSGLEEWILRAFVGGSGISVDAVYGAGSEGPFKPNPRALFTAYRDAGIPIWRGLHAGQDIDEDVRPAMVLGLRTAWVNRYGEEEPEEGIASEYIVGSLGELAEQLSEGRGGRDLDGWLRRHEGPGGDHYPRVDPSGPRRGPLSGHPRPPGRRTA